MEKQTAKNTLIPSVDAPAEVELFRKSFYGNKRGLLAPIVNLLPHGATTIIDLFGGTGVVAWMFKKLGYRVISNDVMRFPALTLRAIVGNNDTVLTDADLRLLAKPNNSRTDYVRRFYSDTFGPENSDLLDTWAANVPLLTDPLKRDLAVFVPIACISKPVARFAAIHWTALGTLTGYRHLFNYDLKTEIRRYAFDILPRLVFCNGHVNEVFSEDAVDLVRNLQADALYVDPPYACRMGEYEGTYALFDDLVSILSGQGDRVKDPYDSRSELAPYTYFGTRTSALTGFAKLFERSRHIPHVIVSYNTTSLIRPSEIAAIAKVYRRVTEMHFIPRRRPITERGKNNQTEEVLMVCAQ